MFLQVVTTPQSEHQVQGRLLLDVVVSQGSAVLQLLASKDQSLLIRGDSLLVLDLCLYVVNGVCWLHIEGDCLASEGFDEDLHSSSESEHQVEGGLFLDVIVRKCSVVFKLLSSKDKSLLIWGDSFFILNLSLDVINCVSRLNIKSDGFTGKGL